MPGCNLHDAVASLDPPFRFFAVFSSVAGVANYAAANSCMNAFVALRCSSGLPACSLVRSQGWHGSASRCGEERECGCTASELPMAAAFVTLELG